MLLVATNLDERGNVRRSGFSAFLVGVLLASLAGLSYGQPLHRPVAGGPGYSPSGTLGGSGGTPDYLKGRSAADVATVSGGGGLSFSGGAGRRPAGAQASAFGLPGASRSGTRLLGGGTGPSTFSSYSRYAKPGTFLDALRLVSHGYLPVRGVDQGGLSATRTRFSSWGAPEMVAKRSEVTIPRSQPADTPSVPLGTPRVTLQQLVKNTLDGRRAICEARALAAFKAGRYHEACDQLVLADATAIEEPDQRVYLKLLFCYAALAAQQYQEAFNAMRWVVSRDDKDGGRAVPSALGRLRNVASLYDNPKEYTDQVALLERILPRDDDPDLKPEIRLHANVLRAFASWGGNDMANARYYAGRAGKAGEQITDPAEKGLYWARFEVYMAAAERGEDSPQFTPASPGDTSSRSPIRPGLLTLEAVPVSTAR